MSRPLPPPAWIKRRRARRSTVSIGPSLLAIAILAGSCGDAGTESDNPTPDVMGVRLEESGLFGELPSIVVSGADFVRRSVVRFDGSERVTHFRSGTELRAILRNEDLEAPGTADISVVNPAPGGGVSNLVGLVIGQPDQPRPAITSIVPAALVAGTDGTTIQVTGEGFTRESVASIADIDQATRYVSDSELEVTLPAAALAASATVMVRVRNPPPGGGFSPATYMEIRGPLPVLSAVEPAAALAGNPESAVEVTGGGFIDNSKVLFDGAPLPTRRLSVSRLEATLDPALLRKAKTVRITVENPPPGGGISASRNLSIENPEPEITLLPSSGASAGRTGFTLTLHGQGFVEGSVVLWDGRDLPTDYLAPTRMAASVVSADVAEPGAHTLSIRNPGPGGGISGAAQINVRVVPPPTLTARIRVPLMARDLVYSERTGLLYATVTGTSEIANQLAAIDPTTGAVVRALFIGDEPDLLALSADGSMLYASLRTGAIQRIDLRTFTPDLTWRLPAETIALDMASPPGMAGTLVVAQSDGIRVYDEGVPRPVAAGGFAGNRIEFLESPDVLYSYRAGSSSSTLLTLRLDAAGVHLQSELSGGISGYQGLVGASGRLYATSGSVIDPEIGARMGTFPVGGVMAIDTRTGRAIVLQTAALYVMDLHSFGLLGVVDLPAFPDVSPWVEHARIVRCGSDGVAFTEEESIVLVRSPIFGI